MTNRSMAYIIRHQHPLSLPMSATVREACRDMYARHVGAVMVTDDKRARLVGILTGRDVVRVLAESRDAETTLLSEVMTPKPDTIGPQSTAVEALRMMSDGGYRHLPVLDGDRIIGIVARSDFCGLELDRLEDETLLWERIA